jgi:hypothetical protein
MKLHSPTVVALPPRPLTSPPRPYKRHHTSPRPSPQTFTAFLIISLGSKLHIHEMKPPPICFPTVGLPPLPHRLLKPRVSFVSLPSPCFSIRGDFSETVAIGGESSGELLPPATVRSTVDRPPSRVLQIVDSVHHFFSFSFFKINQNPIKSQKIALSPSAFH